MKIKCGAWLRMALLQSASVALVAAACEGSTPPTAVDMGLGDFGGADVKPGDSRSNELLLDLPNDHTLPPDYKVDVAGPDGQADAPANDGLGADTATGPSVWGWISVIEWNDVCDQWYLKTQWFGGVRAYFAEEPSFQRSLPHTLGFMTLTATVGSCTLYDSGLMNPDCLQTCLCLDKGIECSNTGPAGRWCEEDEVCVAGITVPMEPDSGICVGLPPHFSVGRVTIHGLKQSVQMDPDTLDRYLKIPTDPNDLFDMGDAIMATTQGGELPPMSFSATGVAPLEAPNQVVSVRQGQASVVSWSPADLNSRIQVYLAVGSHDPNPLGGAIVCDVPDSAGSVEIDYSLLEKLYTLSCNGQWLQKCGRITRYTQDLQKMGNQDVQLFVGSARNLQMLFE